MVNVNTLEKIKEEALENDVPIMQDDSMNFVTDYIIKNNINKVLEIGTAVGYSSIVMALSNPIVRIVSIERDKERFEGNSYHTIRSTEGLYARISRPFPLAGIIMFAIASVLLAMFFVLQKTFPFYIVFLFASLTCYGVSIQLLIIFLVILLKRRSLLKRVVKNVAIEAGTNKEYPLQNNIKKETDKTWLIANNL